MPSELFSSRLFVVPSLVLCFAMGAGCAEEDPFAHLRDSTSDTDKDDEDTDTDTGGKGNTADKDDTSDKTDSEGSTSGGGSGKDDSTGDDSEGSDGSTGGEQNDSSDDTGTETDNTDKPPTNQLCALRPSRLAILGDATPAGKTVSGGDSDSNAFKILHAHLKAEHKLAELSYENHARDGSKFVEVDEKQMLEVPGEDKGPVMVVVHSGSHDLAAYIIKGDDQARNDFDGEWAKSLASLKKLVAYFDNKDKFPNGSTIILNTLYNPFDDCQEPHNAVSISKTKTELMGQFNQNLRDFAGDYDHIVVADHHPAFLGHGHHHDNSKCPHYKAGSSYLMQGGLFDLTNLSEDGHAFMGNILKDTVDKMFKGCS